MDDINNISLMEKGFAGLIRGGRAGAGHGSESVNLKSIIIFL